MPQKADILGLGAVTVDDLLFVPSYPGPDSKMQVSRRERHCGGLAATAMVAAARLGARCALAGALGDDELSRFAWDCLAREGIDLSHMRRVPSARPIHSTIVVVPSEQTRTIFFNVEGFVGGEDDWPELATIEAARVLFVDHCGVAGMLRAARIARRRGIPVVADLERDADPLFPALLAEVDHLIVSRDFAARLTGCGEPAAAAAALRAPGRRVVAVTCGAAGCWFLSPENPRPQHQPAFAVEAVDTTGCGDVFHGAYAAALLRAMDTPARIRFAAAAAALKATRPGGQEGSPRDEELGRFLEKMR